MSVYRTIGPLVIFKLDISLVISIAPNLDHFIDQIAINLLIPGFPIINIGKPDSQ